MKTTYFKYEKNYNREHHNQYLQLMIKGKIFKASAEK